MALILIYMKTVTPSEPDNQLNVSTSVITEFVDIHGGERHALLYFRDMAAGELWDLEFCTRKTGGFLKPYISRATWRRFTQAKGIRAGDRIRFYKRIHQGGEEFFVRVQREKPVMLMGVEIGTHWVDI